MDYLDDDLQGSDLLVRGPGLLQGLVELLNAVGVILLGEVQQLSLGALHTQKSKIDSYFLIDSLCVATVRFTSKNLNTIDFHPMNMYTDANNNAFGAV